ncbi:hypothetical protein [Caldivirga sp. UBA161]|uniref:hypothetical protein n=1 Tax=Caldivirga sp. UBA161 TaxID=1915569 RepID=UPI0025BBF6FC|nr:hypothetical protein [Caldivirga sp. UBA161]
MNYCRLTLILMIIIGMALIIITDYLPLIPLAALLPLLLLIKPKYCEYATFSLAALLPLVLLPSQGLLPLSLGLIEELLYASLLITRLTKAGGLIMALNMILSVALFTLYYFTNAWRPLIDYVVSLIPLTSGQIMGISLLNSMMLTVVSIIIIDYVLLRMWLTHAGNPQ